MADPDAILMELFTDDAARADPHPRFHALRELAPVHRSAIGAWVLSRYDDCSSALRDGRLGKGIESISRRVGLSEEEQARQAEFRREHRSLLWLDPPDHTRLRGLVARAFTPRTVEAMRPRIERMTDDLLDGLTGEVDVVEALALPLPIDVIGELLGVPPADRPRFQPLSRAGTLAFEPTATPETIAAANAAGLEMEAYFADVLDRRRTEPGDDLLTRLLAVEEQGDVLTRAEVVSTAIVLFGAGFETTANLIGNGLLALLRHPEQLARLRSDRALLPTAVEELLRYDSPVQVNARVTLEPLVIDGNAVDTGEMVVTLLGAANRDPARFTDPDRLDVGRDEGPSLSFGAGIHHCLGAALARVEGEIVLGRLLDRFADIELVAEPTWRSSVTMRGLESLQVRFSPA